MRPLSSSLASLKPIFVSSKTSLTQGHYTWLHKQLLMCLAAPLESRQMTISALPHLLGGVEVCGGGRWALWTCCGPNQWKSWKGGCPSCEPNGTLAAFFRWRKILRQQDCPHSVLKVCTWIVPPGSTYCGYTVGPKLWWGRRRRLPNRITHVEFEYHLYISETLRYCL